MRHHDVQAQTVGVVFNVLTTPPPPLPQTKYDMLKAVRRAEQNAQQVLRQREAQGAHEQPGTSSPDPQARATSPLPVRYFLGGVEVSPPPPARGARVGSPSASAAVSRLAMSYDFDGDMPGAASRSPPEARVVERDLDDLAAIGVLDQPCMAHRRVGCPCTALAQRQNERATHTQLLEFLGF
jgi:hypothetical protein